jgi:hypothetical protein
MNGTASNGPRYNDQSRAGRQPLMGHNCGQLEHQANKCRNRQDDDRCDNKGQRAQNGHDGQNNRNNNGNDVPNHPAQPRPNDGCHITSKGPLTQHRAQLGCKLMPPETCSQLVSATEQATGPALATELATKPVPGPIWAAPTRVQTSEPAAATPWSLPAAAATEWPIPAAQQHYRRNNQPQQTGSSAKLQKPWPRPER